jgi:hypothetical protein
VAKQKEGWIARSDTERHHMSATTVLRAVGLVLCLPGLVPTAVRTAQPSDQDASPSQSPAHLTQSEVLTLAKTAARKVVRQKLYDYDITSVIFDSHAREWSVWFTQQPLHTASHGCFYVYVKDDTKGATVQPC